MNLSLKTAIVFLLFSLHSPAKAEEAATEKNLLKWNFDTITAQGIPDGYETSFSKESNGSISIVKEDKANVVRMELPEQGTGFLDTTNVVGLIKGRKYIFTVQLKIEGQKYSGEGEHFFYVCLYNTPNNEHIYTKLGGTGDTDGWITSVILVDTVKNPGLVGCKIFFRGYNVSGTYYLKTPYLIEVPDDLKVNPQIVLSNNKSILGAFFNLKDIVLLNK